MKNAIFTLSHFTYRGGNFLNVGETALDSSANYGLSTYKHELTVQIHQEGRPRSKMYNLLT